MTGLLTQALTSVLSVVATRFTALSSFLRRPEDNQLQGRRSKRRRDTTSVVEAEANSQETQTTHACREEVPLPPKKLMRLDTDTTPNEKKSNGEMHQIRVFPIEEIHEEKNAKRLQLNELESLALLVPPETYIRSGDGYCRISPYIYTYTSYVKGRWAGRTLQNVLTDEFLAMPQDYYRRAVNGGGITLNGRRTELDAVLSIGDVLRHRLHRHEPPVPETEPKVLARQQLGATQPQKHRQQAPVAVAVAAEPMHEIVLVEKPAGIPMHPAGRYRHNSLIPMLRSALRLPSLAALFRIDRQTSGLVLLVTDSRAAAKASVQFMSQRVEKMYLCRVRGIFPSGRVRVSAAMAPASHKHGVQWVVHEDAPGAKQTVTIFERVDSITDKESKDTATSLVVAWPQTGRTHQIRVHLRHIGYPIANDGVYGRAKAADGNDDINYFDRNQARINDAREKCCATSEITVGGLKVGEEGDGEPLRAVAESRATGPRVSGWCSECNQAQYDDPGLDECAIYLHAFRYVFGGDLGFSGLQHPPAGHEAGAWYDAERDETVIQASVPDWARGAENALCKMIAQEQHGRCIDRSSDKGERLAE